MMMFGGVDVVFCEVKTRFVEETEGDVTMITVICEKKIEGLGKNLSSSISKKLLETKEISFCDSPGLAGFLWLKLVVRGDDVDYASTVWLLFSGLKSLPESFLYLPVMKSWKTLNQRNSS